MEIANIQVNGTRAKWDGTRKALPVGLVGGYIHVEYTDPIWDTLTKTVVFKGAVTKDVVTGDTTVQIPAEVTAQPVNELLVGFYGTRGDGTLVIPTFWVDIGPVREAADPSGDESTNLTLPVWAQLAARIGDLEEDCEGMTAVLYTPQALTLEQKAQAVNNIGAMAYIYRPSKNLADLIWENGDIKASGFVPHTSGKYNAGSQSFISVLPGTQYTFSAGSLHTAWLSVYCHYYDENKNHIKYDSFTFVDTVLRTTMTTPVNACFIRVNTYGETNQWTDSVPNQFQIEAGTEATSYEKPGLIRDINFEAESVYEKVVSSGAVGISLSGRTNPILKQIAHRGYRQTGAPQCTEPAYITAKIAGFSAGENDLQRTSDGVFVMNHDDVMPSDNSVAISTNTYETIKNYSMGTFHDKTCNIMTLEEWIVLMKQLGLEAYIDLKITFTAETAAEAVAIVRKHGMLDKVTWSGNAESMVYVRTADPAARVAIIGATTVWETIRSLVVENRPDLTILYPRSTDVTADVVTAATAAGVNVECWLCDYAANGFATEEQVMAEIDRVVSAGVTGICLDTYLPGDHFMSRLLAKWNGEGSL